MPTFRFQTDPASPQRFTCPLTSLRCSATSDSTGNRCRRRVVMGLPMCWGHLLAQHHLKAAPSGTGNGKGLFATKSRRLRLPAHIIKTAPHRVFKKNETIIANLGDTINRNEMIRRYGLKTAPHAVELSADQYMDSACRRGMASFAKHRTNPNARFSVHHATGRVTLKARRPIYDGEEIFVSYGPTYNAHDGSVHSTR